MPSAFSSLPPSLLFYSPLALHTSLSLYFFFALFLLPSLPHSTYKSHSVCSCIICWSPVVPKANQSLQHTMSNFSSSVYLYSSLIKSPLSGSWALGLHCGSLDKQNKSRPQKGKIRSRPSMWLLYCGMEGVAVGVGERRRRKSWGCKGNLMVGEWGYESGRSRCGKRWRCGGGEQEGGRGVQ